MEISLIAKHSESRNYQNIRDNTVEVHHITDKPCRLEAVFVHGGKLKKVFAGNHILYADHLWSNPGGIIHSAVRISVVVDLELNQEANVILTIV